MYNLFLFVFIMVSGTLYCSEEIPKERAEAENALMIVAAQAREFLDAAGNEDNSRQANIKEAVREAHWYFTGYIEEDPIKAARDISTCARKIETLLKTDSEKQPE